MREIKFRAWWPDVKKMRHFGEPIIILDSEERCGMFLPVDPVEGTVGCSRLRENLAVFSKEAGLMGYLIGFCGYAQVGKDTAAQFMPGWRREAFGDEMRADLTPVLANIEKLARATGGRSADPLVVREIERPLLVAYAEAMRKMDPCYWVGRLWGQLAERAYGNVVITDVRNVYEVERILDPGLGFISLGIIYIHRPGYGPANAREAQTILEIMERWPGRFPRVVNDGTRKELGAKVIDVINYLVGNL